MADWKEAVRVLKEEASAIQNAAQTLAADPKTQIIFDRAIERLSHSLDTGGKIILTGMGKSGKIGKKIAATLSSTGSTSIFLHPSEGLHGDLGLVQNQDCIIALSHSGNTEEILKLLPPLKERKIPIIGFGGNSESRLAQNSDFWIHLPILEEACPHHLAPTTSTTLHLAMGDAVAVALMKKRGFEKADFARNHPAGALGNRLNLKVESLMHRGSSVPTLLVSASIQEIVMALTERKLGAALIVEGSKLIGIVTDGDLRRAMKSEASFFSFRAKDIMTKTPVTISPEATAYEALQKMENRESQIHVLPVTDHSGNWMGIIRIHDLLQKL